MCDPCCSPCGPCGPCGPCEPCGPCGPCGPCDPCCGYEPRACKSRELRAGVMYTSCDCVKRNGLQDSCPRSLCQGRSGCMCLPNPSCCPSSHSRRFLNVTMGVNRKRNRCSDLPCPPCFKPSSCNPCVRGPCDPCGSPCGPCCPPGSCESTSTPCCGPPDYPGCGYPVPLPESCNPCVCPPLMEGGVPDPKLWSSCCPPNSYPCYI